MDYSKALGWRRMLRWNLSPCENSESNTLNFVLMSDDDDDDDCHSPPTNSYVAFAREINDPNHCNGLWWLHSDDFRMMDFVLGYGTSLHVSFECRTFVPEQNTNNQCMRMSIRTAL